MMLQPRPLLHLSKETLAFVVDQFVCLGLNDERRRTRWNSETRSRVLQLLRDFQQLESIKEQLRNRMDDALRKKSISSVDVPGWPALTFRDLRSEKLNKTGAQLVRRINRQLGCYTFFPSVCVSDFAKPIREEPRHWKKQSQSSYQEQSAVIVLLNLLSQGTINRLRQCVQCLRWFCSVTNHQRHCNENCRKHRAACSDEFKRKRAEYMQVYRRREKERDANAKRLARTKGAK